jgi:hypothetical protein
MSVSGTLRRTARYLSTQFARLRGVRRVRLYCVGTAKSGTHSIAAMFGGSVRARHEADNRRDIREILEVAAGRVDRDRMKRYVRRRDRRLYLDIDSSQVNFFMLDALLTEFPGARFLLTIRDPYSWLDSIINDSLRRPSNRSWTDFRNFCFRSDIFSHPPPDHGPGARDSRVRRPAPGGHRAGKVPRLQEPPEVRAPVPGRSRPPGEAGAAPLPAADGTLLPGSEEHGGLFRQAVNGGAVSNAATARHGGCASG